MCRFQLYVVIFWTFVFISALSCLLINSFVKIVRILISFGVETLFPFAVMVQNEMLLRCLIKAGANVRACIYRNKTALHLLLQEEEKECSDNSLLRSLWRPLLSETESNHRVKIAKLLIQHGADVNAIFHKSDETTPRWSVLHSECNRALIKLFLDCGADIDRKYQNARSVVQEYLADATYTLFASNRGGIEPTFLRLIQPSNNYTSPLHEACIFHRTHEIRELTILLADGEINAKDAFGHTPLYYAVMSNGVAPEDKKSTVKFLLDLGADINLQLDLQTARNAEECRETSILEIAVWLGDCELSKILLQHAAKLVDLEFGDEKKALSEFNVNFIHNLKYNLKLDYVLYADQLKELREEKLLSESQSSPSHCSIC